MTQQTSKGITYPESSDHTRIWEHMQTLATNADGVIPGSVDVQVFTTSGTWTRPSGAIWVVVELMGGGGGSGGCPTTTSAQAACSGGGGGGEYARGIFTASSAGTSQSVTVGTGGAGGAAGANNGNAGNASSFGALISANGGSGGFAGVATTSALANGGLGGSGGTGGNLHVAGTDGGNGAVLSTLPVKFNTGGASFLAGGRRGTTVLTGNSNGFDGYTYGGGAAGSSNGPSQGTAAGGKGGDGVVIVTTYKA